MTDYEIKKIARRQAVLLADALKRDEELLDLLSPPRYMTVDEAAEMLRMPVSTLYAKIEEIPHTKVGRRLLFKDRALVRWVERRGELNKKQNIKKNKRL